MVIILPPVTTHGSCQIDLGGGSVFMTGGRYLRDGAWVDIGLAYIFHPLDGWRKLPNMHRARGFMMCGLVTDREGNKKIVVAGGISE